MQTLRLVSAVCTPCISLVCALFTPYIRLVYALYTPCIRPARVPHEPSSKTETQRIPTVAPSAMGIWQDRVPPRTCRSLESPRHAHDVEGARAMPAKPGLLMYVGRKMHVPDGRASWCCNRTRALAGRFAEGPSRGRARYRTHRAARAGDWRAARPVHGRGGRRTLARQPPETQAWEYPPAGRS